MVLRVSSLKIAAILPLCTGVMIGASAPIAQASACPEAAIGVMVSPSGACRDLSHITKHQHTPQKPEKARKFVPFNGSLSIVNPTRTPIFDSNGNFIGTKEEGTGRALQLGKFNALFISQPLSQLSFKGSIVMTAKNGDKVNLSFQNAVIQVPPVDGKFPITFSAQITGGTGKFANATGSVAFDGFSQVAPQGDFGPTFFKFKGQISAPGSRKS
jgi:hypothetical protein